MQAKLLRMLRIQNCRAVFAGQMFLMDKFFDGEFLTFGLEVLRLSEEDEHNRVDPMIRIFPRMTKCLFHKVGPSMTVGKF
jgi:hypothetical protein